MGAPSAKDQLNVRISPLGKELLYALQEHFGLSQAGVIEMLLREKAREVGIEAKNSRKLGNNRGR